MGDMREVFNLLNEHTKQEHEKRVAKTPSRVEYAIKQFEMNDIEYQLKNPATGHFHCRRKCDDKLFEFWAGTGKIKGYDHARGIHALLRLLAEEEVK